MQKMDKKAVFILIVIGAVLGSAIMAYNADIPQATDQIDQSQGDLLANFQALKQKVLLFHKHLDCKLL